MGHLKLLAFDAHDLQIISSCCQDSVMRIGELDFSPTLRTFVMGFNRFVWEKDDSRERRKTLLGFSNVNSIRVFGIDQSHKNRVISLLAILFESGEKPGGTIELVFAGECAIRLDVECIEAQLCDLPVAWETTSKPSHEQD